MQSKIESRNRLISIHGIICALIIILKPILAWSLKLKWILVFLYRYLIPPESELGLSIGAQRTLLGKSFNTLLDIILEDPKDPIEVQDHGLSRTSSSTSFIIYLSHLRLRLHHSASTTTIYITIVYHINCFCKFSTPHNDEKADEFRPSGWESSPLQKQMTWFILGSILTLKGNIRFRARA